MAPHGVRARVAAHGAYGADGGIKFQRWEPSPGSANVGDKGDESFQERFYRYTGINMGSRAGAGLQSKSKLLNPDFPFIRGVRILTTLLLLYVAVVVQIQVGFFWHSAECDRTYTEYFDMFIDGYFILEIMINFYTGVWFEGIYHDRWRFVAYHYVTTSFGFDIITSIPVSTIEFILRQMLCEETVTSENAESYEKLKMLRIVKPLRIFKLLRLLKASRTE